MFADKLANQTYLLTNTLKIYVHVGLEAQNFVTKDSKRSRFATLTEQH
jgi:hypothetical protein